MTSIPVAASRIWCNNFKRHYLKNKNLLWFFIAFLKSSPNLEYCEKKDESPSLTISEIIDYERDGT